MPAATKSQNLPVSVEPMEFNSNAGCRVVMPSGRTWDFITYMAPQSRKRRDLAAKVALYCNPYDLGRHSVEYTAARKAATAALAGKAKTAPAPTA